MGHPLQQFSNFEIRFKKGTGQFTRDLVSGNRNETFTTVKVICTMEVNAKGKPDELPGLNPSTIYLKGNCVSPKVLPSFVKAMDRSEAILTDLSTGQKINGEFVLLLPAQTRFYQVTKVLGSEIAGFFQVS